MWIELSKILPYLVFPLSLFLESQVLAAILYKFAARRAAMVVFILGYIILLSASSPIVATVLNRQLEGWYVPVQASDAPKADAAVLLGGALSLPLPPRVSAELSDASDRVLYTARLYHSGRISKIIVTGGNVFKQQEGVQVESWYISRLLQEWGIPESDIYYEGNSRNTRENAIETKKLMQRYDIRSVLLVTSAFHLPRAASTFRALDISIIPLPVDFRFVNSSQPLLLSIFPSSGALGATTHALREYLGIFVYGLRGWLEPAK